MLTQVIEKLLNPDGLYGSAVIDRVKKFIDNPTPAYERKAEYKELINELRGEVSYYEQKTKKLKALSEFVDDYFFSEIENLEQANSSLEGELERSKDQI